MTPDEVKPDLAGVDEFSVVCQSLLPCVLGRVSDGAAVEKGVGKWLGI